MTEIKDEITKFIENKDKQEEFYNFLSDKLNYKADKVYYNNEKYEKYIKPYQEKNREAINKKRAENYKIKKEKKRETNLVKIEDKLNITV